MRPTRNLDQEIILPTDIVPVSPEYVELSWDEQFSAAASVHALRELILLSADAEKRYGPSGDDLVRSQFYISATPILSRLVQDVRNGLTPPLPSQPSQELIKYQSDLVAVDNLTGGDYQSTGILPANVLEVLPPWAPSHILELHAQNRPVEAMMYGITAAAVRFARARLPHKDTSGDPKYASRHPNVFGYAVTHFGVLPSHFKSVPSLMPLQMLTDQGYAQSQRELSALMRAGDRRAIELGSHGAKRRDAYTQLPPIA